MSTVTSSESASSAPDSAPKSRHFIRQIVEEDLRSGATGGKVITRFPPEPNGYLHIGHAKSICLNFGLAQEYGGRCHLRFDDTNPETEDMHFVEAIQRDIRWLGFEWEPHLYFASDYFEELYAMAEQLVRDGKAYVDDLNEEEIREYRGTVHAPGRPSPWRDRSVEENLDLLHRMRQGEFPDGAKVLRAKIDMAHPNMKMRDPLMYRIRHAEHYRRGNEWHIYPMYDWAHGQSDAIESITHSICTLEFENNRELYDWFLDNLGIDPRPHQYEFARLYLDYTVMSKRKLIRLVNEGYVNGWDDPRMTTLAGMRRRGYRPEAIREFAEGVGVARVNSRVTFELLEHYVRSDLNYEAPRVLCVLNPLKVVITNYPHEKQEVLEADYWPRDVPRDGTRPLPFAREIYIERDDFMETPTKKFRRLSPGKEVRLRYAYVIRCDDVIKDPVSGEIVELHCSYDPETRGGEAASGRVQGTIHWVAAEDSVPCEVRLYDRLFVDPAPDDAPEGVDFTAYVNPESLAVLTGCRVERSVAGVAPGTRFQFERQGYFVADIVDSTPSLPIFNRIVALRESWSPPSPQDTPMQGRRDAKTEQEPAEPVVGTISAARQAAREADALLAARFESYQREQGLTESDADMLTADRETGDYFEAALSGFGDARLVAGRIINGLLPATGDDGALAGLPVTPLQLARLTQLIAEDTINSNAGDKLLARMLEAGGDPDQLVDEMGLRQVSDPAVLSAYIEEVMAENAEKVAAYRAGKTGLFGFFVGQTMRKTGNRAKPQLVQQLLGDMLAE